MRQDEPDEGDKDDDDEEEEEAEKADECDMGRGTRSFMHSSHVLCSFRHSLILSFTDSRYSNTGARACLR